MGKKEDFAKRIGNNLKLVRKQRGLTLKKLAGLTNLSAPLISKIENGLTMPSIPTLLTISEVLKVDMGFFFEQEEEKNYIISPAGTRKVQYSKRGSLKKVSYELEALIEGMENPFMHPFIVTLLADKSDQIQTITHEGQEFLYVLEGRMELTLGDRKFVLKKGDAAYWNGTVPHKGISLSKKPARTLNVHLIPGKRDLDLTKSIQNSKRR
jgi:transcriptional regulator with XRE-family HTH domain